MITAQMITAQMILNDSWHTPVGLNLLEQQACKPRPGGLQLHTTIVSRYGNTYYSLRGPVGLYSPWHSVVQSPQGDGLRSSPPTLRLAWCRVGTLGRVSY